MYRTFLSALFVWAGLMPSFTQAQVNKHTSQSLNQLEQQSLDEAHIWAINTDSPLRLESSNSSVATLVRIEHGMPVYLTTHNQQAGILTQTHKLHANIESPFTLTGSGLQIGIWDEGGLLNSHQELEFKINIKDLSGPSNHSTHVGGTLIASGRLPEAKGMAPMATVNSYNWNFHTSEMQAEANAGLLISNHSYGRVGGWHESKASNGSSSWLWFGKAVVSEEEDYVFGLYDKDASLFDYVAFQNPHYLPVVSAGNERDDKGPLAGNYRALNRNGRWITYDVLERPIQKDGGEKGYDTITSFAVAKNTLTVGSVGMNTETSGSQSVTQISKFSSAGPTDDGRIKPDLMGMGENLLSAIASGSQDYARYSGTSMATPNVAGSLLLLQQLANKVRNAPLRAATLKGLAIHTATDIGPKGPDYYYGWGLLDAFSAAMHIQDAFENPDQIQELSMENGKFLSHNMVATESGPIKVTLSWTDPPAQAFLNAAGPFVLNNRTPKLINDLDIQLKHVESGNVYQPFVLSVENPEALATQGDNIVDPIEQIYIADAQAGEYELSISHKGQLAESQSQPFSLLVTGLNADLPFVELKEASVESAIGEVLLKWQTSIEHRAGTFVIERSSINTEPFSEALSLSYQAVAEVLSTSPGLTDQSYEYTDNVYLSGQYLYRVIFKDELTNTRVLLSELSVDIPVPASFAIESIFPNPAVTQSQVVLDVPKDTDISYKIYDILGKELTSEHPKIMKAGRHFINLTTENWAAGVYFVQILSPDQQLIRKMVVIK